MPREIYLVSREPLTLEALVAAGVQVDGELVPRGLFDGNATQLLDLDDVAVLTVENSRLLQDTADLERIVGPLPLTGDAWWTEATAPWGPAGETGVRIAYVLGELLGARVQVEEGA
jgi:hypothetical protein